jgi:type I site-specific restriction endonuclease
MPFTVDDFHDFIRLIEARPEWRTELRRLVLTDELLAMPEQLAELRAHSEQQFIALAEAQQRTEARLTALAEAQQRTEARLTALTDAQQQTEARLTALADTQQRAETRLTTLADAQQHLETQMATLTSQVTALAEQVTTLTVQVRALARTVQTLVDDVGELKGQSLEAMYRSKGHAYFSRLLRRPHVLAPDELTALIEDARDRGVLSEVDARELYDIDLAVRGRSLEDSTEVFLVVEISWGVGPYDVERAAQRAVLLSRTGLVTMAVVAGKRILPAAATLARRTQVWQVTDGQAIPPDPVSASS